MEKTYSLDSLLEEFSSYEVKEKRRSRGSVVCYKKDMKIILPDELYEEFLKELKEKYGEITDKEYYNGLVEITGERIKNMDSWNKDKPSTKNRRISSTNTFLNFLEKTRKIKKAPHFKGKRIKREPLNTITEEEFSKLMEVTPYDKYKNARDRAIFSLIFFSGIKESEVANLGYKNFRSENGITYLNVGEGYKKGN